MCCSCEELSDFYCTSRLHEIPENRKKKTIVICNEELQMLRQYYTIGAILFYFFNLILNAFGRRNDNAQTITFMLGNPMNFGNTYPALLTQ